MRQTTISEKCNASDFNEADFQLCPEKNIREKGQTKQGRRKLFYSGQNLKFRKKFSLRVRTKL